MFWKVSAVSLVVFLMLAAPAEMPGHGRNSTTFRANVEDASVSIELQAVVLDLLQLAGISEVEWEESPESAREATLRLGASVFGWKKCLKADRVHCDCSTCMG